MKLSKRLIALSEFVPPGAKVVDVGCDHGLLPCYLVKAGISPYVIGVDVHQGPYLTARRSVLAQGLEEQVDIRFGDGLFPVEAGEAAVLILAGMGGGTIKEILKKSPQVIEKTERMILQPMKGEDVLRRWLAAHSWLIVAEDIIVEDGHFYQIIVAEKGPTVELSDLEADYGRLLIQNRHQLLPGLLEKDISGVQEILLQLAKSKSSKAREKYRAFHEKLTKMKELKECLLAAKQS